MFAILFYLGGGFMTTILVVSLSTALHILPIHPLSRLFGVRLSISEVIVNQIKLDAASKKYAATVEKVIADRDISLCSTLPESESFFDESYVVISSGGPEYPHYGGWFSRANCVYAAALEFKDPQLCTAGNENGFLNIYQVDNCIANLGIQDRHEGDSDVTDICDLIDSRDYHDECLDERFSTDLKDYYKKFNLE